MGDELIQVPPRKRGSAVASNDSGDETFKQIQAMFDEQENKLHATIKMGQQQVVSNVAKLVSDRYDKLDARTTEVENKVGGLGQEQIEIKKRMDVLETENRKLHDAIGLANQNALQRTQVESTQFDRPPNIEVLKMSTKRFVTRVSIENAITPWLVNVCEIDQNLWKIVGGAPSGKNYTVVFLQNPLTNATLVDKAIKNLKDPNGEWRVFNASRPGGLLEKIRIDRDENPKTRTQRRMAACLIKTLEMHALEAGRDFHKRFDNRTGRVSVFCDNGEGVCTMCPTSATITRDFFYWNNPALQQLGLDKESLLAETMRLFDRPEDNIPWSL